MWQPTHLVPLPMRAEVEAGHVRGPDADSSTCPCASTSCSNIGVSPGTVLVRRRRSARRRRRARAPPCRRPAPRARERREEADAHVARDRRRIGDREVDRARSRTRSGSRSGCRRMPRVEIACASCTGRSAAARRGLRRPSTGGVAALTERHGSSVERARGDRRPSWRAVPSRRHDRDPESPRAVRIARHEQPPVRRAAPARTICAAPRGSTTGARSRPDRRSSRTRPGCGSSDSVSAVTPTSVPSSSTHAADTPSSRAHARIAAREPDALAVGQDADRVPQISRSPRHARGRVSVVRPPRRRRSAGSGLLHQRAYTMRPLRDRCPARRRRCARGDASRGSRRRRRSATGWSHSAALRRGLRDSACSRSTCARPASSTGRGRRSAGTAAPRAEAARGRARDRVRVRARADGRRHRRPRCATRCRARDRGERDAPAVVRHGRVAHVEEVRVRDQVPHAAVRVAHAAGGRRSPRRAGVGPVPGTPARDRARSGGATRTRSAAAPVTGGAVFGAAPDTATSTSASGAMRTAARVAPPARAVSA